MATDADDDDGGLLDIGSEPEPDPEEVVDVDTDDLDWEKLMANGHHPEVIDLPPPKITGSRFGMVGNYYAYRKHRKQQKKLAKQGYVKWHLVEGGTWRTPKYVKPEFKNGGMRELKHDGIRYLFPERAKVPDAQSGMWTFVHKHGEPIPLNLNEPSELSLKGDELDNYVTDKVTSDRPSWFDNFDLDPDLLIKGSVAAIILFAIVQRAWVML